LAIFPRQEGTDIEIIAKSPDDTGNHLFTASIETQLEGNQFNSPYNRNSVRSKGFYADPIELKPIQWKVVGEKFREKTFFKKVNFIDQFNHDYLNSGTLTLNCRFSIKTVEIVNEIKRH
jgi:hypothetical protein